MSLEQCTYLERTQPSAELFFDGNAPVTFKSKRSLAVTLFKESENYFVSDEKINQLLSDFIEKLGGKTTTILGVLIIWEQLIADYKVDSIGTILLKPNFERIIDLMATSPRIAKQIKAVYLQIKLNNLTAIQEEIQSKNTP